MKNFLLIAQILVTVFLIILILLQQRGSALGTAFGSETGFYATQRGLQKKIWGATCILGAVFIFLALLNLAV